MNQYTKLTKLLFLITSISVVLAVLSLINTSKKGTLDSEETNFAVADSSKISGILIEHNGKKIKLILENNKWKTAENVSIDDYLMYNFLDFITKTTVKKPIANEDEIQIKKQISENGISITVLKSDEVLSKFNLLFEEENTIAYKDGFSKPYILNENLSETTKNALEIADLNCWKNTVIFSSKPNTIERLSVIYTDSVDQDFTIKRGKFQFEIENMNNMDSLKTSAYLKLYEKIDIKRFCIESEQYKKDSLLKTTPTFLISLNDKFKEKSNSIAIYYVNGQKPPIYGLVGTKNELCVIKPRVFEYLLQKRSFFQQK